MVYFMGCMFFSNFSRQPYVINIQLRNTNNICTDLYILLKPQSKLGYLGFVFLIDDLTTIELLEYLKLTLSVYLVHSKVHERYKFFDYQKRQNNNSTFRAKALQYYDRRIQ